MKNSGIILSLLLVGSLSAGEVNLGQKLERLTRELGEIDGVVGPKLLECLSGQEQKQVQAAAAVADKKVADAKAAIDRSAKELAAAKVASTQAAAQAAEARKPAEAFKPKVDTAKANHAKLHAEYLKLKPKKT